MTGIEPTWSMEKALPSDVDLGHAAIDELIRALELANWNGRDLFHVQMAIEEAVVNAIEHGNNRDRSKHVRLHFRVSPEQANLIVEDQGPGFDHRNMADPTDEDHLDLPRGRGVLLIRELMSEVHYNERGNRVHMIKNRSKDEPVSDDDQP